MFQTSFAKNLSTIKKILKNVQKYLPIAKINTVQLTQWSTFFSKFIVSQPMCFLYMNILKNTVKVSLDFYCKSVKSHFYLGNF
jgi:hypothetical protein